MGTAPHASDSGSVSDRWPVREAAVLAVAFALVYLPAAGHGLIKDDFVWIASSRVHSLSDLASFLRAPTGFFRPVVSLSFAANYAACGVTPLCYGLTNVALAAGCAAMVALLGVAMGLSRAGAVAAAALWAFNMHGIDMATLWVSGRTALLLTLAATSAARALLRGRVATAFVWSLLAMGSKEEAVMLPIIMLAWSFIADQARATYEPSGADTSHSHAARFRALWVMGLALAVYGVARASSGAFTPGHAPAFYQFQFTPGRVLENGLQYADRAATVSAAVVALFWAAGAPGWIRLSDATRRTILMGLVWAAGGYALTVFLPVRSSLYACFPSVGIAIAAASLLSEGWQAAPEGRRRLALVAGLLLPFTLWPVYSLRHSRVVEEAELSQATLTALTELRREHRGTLSVQLRDDRPARPTFDAAFGTLAQEAVHLVVGDDVVVSIDPPPTDARFAVLTPVPTPDVVLERRGTSVARTR